MWVPRDPPAFTEACPLFQQFLFIVRLGKTSLVLSFLMRGRGMLRRAAVPPSSAGNPVPPSAPCPSHPAEIHSKKRSGTAVLQRFYLHRDA